MDGNISKISDHAGAIASASRLPRTAAVSPRGGAALGPEGTAPVVAERAARAGMDEEFLGEANRHLARLNSRLQFRMDEESGRVVVTVVDRETSEVLRQIPNEEMLVVARRLEEQLQALRSETGVLISDEV